MVHARDLTTARLSSKTGGRRRPIGLLTALTQAVIISPANRNQRGVSFLTRVIVDDNESFESALKRFNKVVQGDRILSEVRRRRFFEKPSIVRKRKKAAKVRKSRRQTMKFLRTNNM
jgi:small subunit ribosomal protein S21